MAVDVMAFLAVVNACSRLGDHVNSFFVLSSGFMGPYSLASVSVLAESWFARLKKVQRSVCWGQKAYSLGRGN